MTLAEHAKRELALLGEDPELSANLVAVVEKFAEFGHSGGSAECATQLLEKLLRYQPLTPIGSDPDEWEDRTEMSGVPMWQNKRDGRAISTDGGKTWYLVGQSKLYGLYRVSEEPRKRGWLSATDGRILVAQDPAELPALAGCDVREFFGVIHVEEWMANPSAGPRELHPDYHKGFLSREGA